MTDGGDEEIIQGYLEGRASSHRTIDRWIRPLVGSRRWGLRDEQDDVLQEVRRRLYENLLYGRFHRNSSLKTYVAQMAKYVCIEFLRKQKRARESDVEMSTIVDPAPDPERELGDEERRALARKALSSLPEDCRQLFDLIFQSELSYEEISRRLGVAPGTVKSRAFRCREALARQLREPDPAASGGGNRAAPAVTKSMKEQ